MPVALWTSPAFVDEARAWVAERLAPLGVSLTGEFDQPHARPWSSAIRFESSEGPFWFKVNGPGTAHEPDLAGLLSELVPGLVPRVIAVERDRGWALTAHAGPVLRSTGEPDQLFEAWETILPAYAEAQLALASHGDAVRATGLPVLRPGDLPSTLNRLVESLAAGPVERGNLSGEHRIALYRTMPQYLAWCQELEASPIPDSVNHDDLHSANICVDGHAYRILDWGDASWGYPLATMLATLNSICSHAAIERTDPRVVRVLDAYLEPFSHLAGPDDLRRWVSLARRVGCVSRALCYVRAFEGEPASAEEAEDWPVRGWLLETFDPEVG